MDLGGSWVDLGWWILVVDLAWIWGGSWWILVGLGGSWWTLGELGGSGVDLDESLWILVDLGGSWVGLGWILVGGGS